MENTNSPTDDASGNGNVGTLNGDPTNVSTSPPPGGFSTRYYEYDGNNDEIKNSDGITQLTGTDFSLVGWIKPSGATEKELTFGGSSAGSQHHRGNFTLRGAIAGDPIEYRMNTSGTNGSWETDDAFIAGNWLHLGVVHDESNINNTPTVYLGGVAKTVGSGLTETSNPTGTFDSATRDSWKSGENHDGSQDFTGDMDELAGFPLLLTSTDINNIMDNGLESDDAGAVPTRNRAMMLMGYATDELFQSYRTEGM